MRTLTALICVLAAASPVLAEDLPPAAPGTPQPRVSQDGRASPTVLLADTDLSHLIGVKDLSETERLLKNIPLSEDGSVRLSFSAFARIEAEWFDNQNFGRVAGENLFFDQTTRIYADVSFHDRFRLFGALQYGDRFSSTAFVPPVARDNLDLHQAFAEVRFGDLFGGDVNDAFVRVGRQELHYGEGRMISARKGPNVADDFDGVLFRGRFGEAVIDTFAVYDVTEKPGTFDNATDTDEGLWGIYASLPVTKNLVADLYYFGDRNRDSAFVQGTFSETRHSVGGRLTYAQENWSWDTEATYQFGNASNAAGQADISAWAIAGRVTYDLSDATWAPTLFVRAGFTSGDTDPNDNTLGTFRAPNPPGRYFGQTTPFGPGNFAGVWLGADLKPTNNLIVSPALRAYWRLSRDDGVYSPSGSIVRGANGDRTFIGLEPAIDAKIQLGRSTSLEAGIGYFFANGYLDDNPPSEDVTRAYARISVNF